MFGLSPRCLAWPASCPDVGGYPFFTFRCLPIILAFSVMLHSEFSHAPVGKQRVHPPRRPSGIFYTANSGIWQTVWLEPVGLRSLSCVNKCLYNVYTKSIQCLYSVYTMSIQSTKLLYGFTHAMYPQSCYTILFLPFLHHQSCCTECSCLLLI